MKEAEWESMRCYKHHHQLNKDSMKRTSESLYYSFNYLSIRDISVKPSNLMEGWILNPTGSQNGEQLIIGILTILSIVYKNRKNTCVNKGTSLLNVTVEGRDSPVPVPVEKNSGRAGSASDRPMSLVRNQGGSSSNATGTVHLDTGATRLSVAKS